MNVPNFLTAMRVISSFAVAILLCIPCKYLVSAAFVLYVVGAVTDWFDGYIARKCNIVTNIGKFMDALCDKIMVIGLFLVLLGLDMFGGYGDFWKITAIFCAFFSSAREFFVSGIRMIAATKSLFEMMQSMGIMRFEAFEEEAISYALTVHGLMDYCSDSEFIGKSSDKGEDMISDYVKSFCMLHEVKEKR